MSMYGRNNANIFNKGPSNTPSSGNIFSRNVSSSNPTNPYTNNNSSYNNASYNSSYNNSYGSSNSSIGDAGSYRVADYKPGQPPRSLEDINLKWKSPDLNPVSIAVRPETMHLSVVELRNQDYCLIRRQKASNQIQKAMEEVLRKKCFNQNLLNSHIVSTMKDPETLRQGPVSMDALKGYRNRPVYGSNSNQGYSSNTASIFNRNNSNTSSIFGGNNTNNNNNSSSIFGSNNNNTGNSSGGNIFGSRNNNASGNIFGNNSNNNMNSSSTNGIFGSNSKLGNIFGNNSAQNSSSSNIFSNNNNMNTSKNIFGNNNNNSNNNNNNSSGNNIFSNNNNNSSNNNILNNSNNSNNNNIFGNRSNTNSNNSNIFGNNQNSNSNNGKNLFNNGNNNGNNLFNNQNQQQNPTNTLINQYAFMKIAENNNQLIQALMQHQQKQLIYTRNSPLTNLYGINHLPHLFNNPTLPNSNSNSNPNPNSFFNGPYPPFPSHSLSNTSSHDDSVDETRYNQAMTESLNPKVQRLLHQSLNPYKASNHVLIHTKLRQNPTEKRQDYPDTQQQLHNHSRITHSQLRFNQESSNDVTNMFQPTKSQFVPQKSQNYHPRQRQYSQDSIIESSERNFFQSNRNQSTLNHMLERNQQLERQTLSRNSSETRKFNLPEGYYCKFKSFDHRQVENLEIGNEFGKIYWPGKFCVYGMDLDGKFQILPNTVNSTVNQLNRKCYATFFSVPEGLQQADEETAKESLKEFLEKWFKDKILLQMFSLNPPEYRIAIQKLSEFRGINEFDPEEQARVQEI